ncbi:MAG TPA: DUF4878 domain-containing protein [Pyrinomonadaceae bacterium]|jgi:hypothetical protein
MRILGIILAFFMVAAGLVACGGDAVRTPSDTFKEYVKASKKKDPTAMKILLSSATMKMHEQEAKAQGTTVDEIVKRETLIAPGQTQVNYRNEVINGDKATIQFQNAYGSWETLPFVKEDGQWKIDKAGYADEIIRQMDEANRKLDDRINNTNSVPTPNP